VPEAKQKTVTIASLPPSSYDAMALGYVTPVNHDECGWMGYQYGGWGPTA